MKLSLNWIKEFVAVPPRSAEELAELITLHVAEVEHVVDQKKAYEGVVIGEMLEFHKHPEADKLHVAKVDIGKSQPLNLIFGQMVNMRVGDRIPVAVAPTTLPSGIEIQKKKLRGVLSEGMLCLDQELGLKEEGISLHYFPDSKPGTPFPAAAGLDDIIFEIDNKAITHRPDLWGHYGFAREFAAIFGKKLKQPASAKQKLANNGKTLKITVKEPLLCPRYIGARITGIKIEASPAWLAKRLAVCGVRSINNIVDATNYAMLELGQPLHAFDARQVKNGEIVVRRARENETFVTLDGVTHTLNKNSLLIADPEKALAIAGIKGGKYSGIENDTTEIILESANFDPVSVRKTSQTIGLRTDAVQRFEKSLDPMLCMTAILRAIELIKKLCPQAEVTNSVDATNFKSKTPKVTLAFDRLFSRVGAHIPKKKVYDILAALEFDVTPRPQKNKDYNPASISVKVPTFRATKDVDIEEDLVEEVARMYGYDKIPVALPALPAKPPLEHRERRLKHEARRILSLGLGITETSLYSFYGMDEIKKALLTEENHVQVENVLSQNQTHLRVSLIPNLLAWVEPAVRNNTACRIFEIGRTYKKTGEYFPLEEKWLAGVFAEKGKTVAETFYEVKGIVEEFLRTFRTPQWKVIETKNPPAYAHPMQCAEIRAGEKTEILGWLFSVHPEVQRNFDTKMPVAAFEINFTKLATLGRNAIRFSPLPKFPGIDIDISVIVKRRARAEEIGNAIRKADANLIKHVSLFDIFEDEKQFGEGKKSLAFRIRLQATDRTLTDDEMQRVHRKICADLEQIGCAVRLG